jgi:hypothetical protein
MGSPSPIDLNDRDLALEQGLEALCQPGLANAPGPGERDRVGRLDLRDDAGKALGNVAGAEVVRTDSLRSETGGLD